MKIVVSVIVLFLCCFLLGVFGSDFLRMESDFDHEGSHETGERETASEKNSPWLTEAQRKMRYDVWFCPVGETEESLRENIHRHNNDRIAPCLFSTTPEEGVYIDCYGSGVTQRTLEDAFQEVGRVNGISEDSGIQIQRFSIAQTELTQLDLAPFYASRMDSLSISDNANMRKLVTSGNPRDHASIQVKEFQISSSPLKSQGFGDTLKYFSNDMTHFSAEALDLNILDNNKNKDSEENQVQSESEFLRGLAAHTNLTKLSMCNCNISGRLESDFLIPKELQSLEEILLDDNSITQIGGNVFHFFRNPLTIGLSSNKLRETSFHPNSGIAQIGRETKLDLSSNQITSLPHPFFEPFLNAHPQNNLNLYKNLLVCDERLSWVKYSQEDLYSQISLAHCSNDPDMMFISAGYIILVRILLLVDAVVQFSEENLIRKILPFLSKAIVVYFVTVWTTFFVSPLVCTLAGFVPLNMETWINPCFIPGYLVVYIAPIFMVGYTIYGIIETYLQGSKMSAPT